MVSGGPGWSLQGVRVTSVLERAEDYAIRGLLGVLGGDDIGLKEAVGSDGEGGLSRLCVGG